MLFVHQQVHPYVCFLPCGTGQGLESLPAACGSGWAPVTLLSSWRDGPGPVKTLCEVTYPAVWEQELLLLSLLHEALQNELLVAKGLVQAQAQAASMPPQAHGLVGLGHWEQH